MAFRMRMISPAKDDLTCLKPKLRCPGGHPETRVLDATHHFRRLISSVFRHCVRASVSVLIPFAGICSDSCNDIFFRQLPDVSTDPFATGLDMSRTFRHPRPIHQTIYQTKFHSRPRHWQFFLLFAFRAPVFLFPFVGVGSLFVLVCLCVFFLGSFSFVPFKKKNNQHSAPSSASLAAAYWR